MELELKSIKNSPKTIENIGAHNTLTKDEKNRHIQSFISQIFSRLNKEEIYVIDRCEGKYAVCENRENQKMKNVNIYELPENVKEGDVLKYKNGIYIVDDDLRQEIEERISNKVKNIFED